MIDFTVNKKNLPFLKDLYDVLKGYYPPDKVQNSCGSSLQTFTFEDDFSIVYALDDWENIKAVWIE